MIAIFFVLVWAIDAKIIWINSMLEFCLRLKLLKLILNFYSLGVTFCLSNLWFQVFGKFFLFKIFFEFAPFFSFFCQLELPS
jgi:hypothetical protein